MLNLKSGMCSPSIIIKYDYISYYIVIQIQIRILQVRYNMNYMHSASIDCDPRHVDDYAPTRAAGASAHAYGA